MASKASTAKKEAALENTNNSSPYFEVQLDTFLFNAGVIGFIDVLKSSGAIENEHYIIKGQTLKVSKIFLLNADLAQGYIDAVCEKFKKDTFFEKIKNDNDKKQVVDEIVKHCEKGKGKYSLAFDMIDSFMGKDYKKLIVSDTAKTLEKILKDKEIIDLINFYSLFKYLGIFIGNFAFLDSANISIGIKKRGESISLKSLFNKFFSEPIKSLSINMNNNTGEKCFSCGINMNKESGYKTKNAYKRHDLTFMNNVGISVDGKASAYWNYQADVYICPLCSFIYICSLIGFTEIDSSFVFVNDNSDIRSLISMKTSVERNYKSEEKKRSILNVVIEKMLEIKTKEISSIQVIIKNIQMDRYDVNEIDKNVVDIVNNTSADLKKLASTFKKVNNITINVFDECIKNIINGTNQYNLMFNLLRADLYVYDLFKLLKIQVVQKYIFSKESNMDDKMKKVYVACEEGGKINSFFDEAKLSSLVYRLTNALHTSNKHLFINIIIRFYNGMSKDIPTIFVQMFPSEDDFKELGYAYVLGLKGAYYNKKENDIKGEKDGE